MMRMLAGLIMTVVALSTVAAPTFAQSGKMTFRYNVATGGIVIITAEGLITEDTPQDFLAYMGQFESGDVASVELISDGGSLGAGMELGRLFRRFKITTGVSNGMEREARCLSACAYAFLGGHNRYIRWFRWNSAGDDWERPASDSLADEYAGQELLGFHSFSHDESLSQLLGRSAVREALGRDIQVVTSTLVNYVVEMGADPEVVVRSSDIPADNFVFFGGDDLVAMRLVTNHPSRNNAPFEMLPDAGSAVAILRSEDYQILFSCHVWDDEINRPTFVLSQAIADNVEDLPTSISKPVLPSHLARLAPLPWSAHERADGHFHANQWLKMWNPVLEKFTFSHDQDFERTERDVTEADFRFYAEDDFFHGMAALSPAEAHAVLTFSEFTAGFRADIHFNWGQRIETTESDREIIDFALRDCVAPRR